MPAASRSSGQAAVSRLNAIGMRPDTDSPCGRPVFLPKAIDLWQWRAGGFWWAEQRFTAAGARWQRLTHLGERAESTSARTRALALVARPTPRPRVDDHAVAPGAAAVVGRPCAGASTRLILDGAPAEAAQFQCAWPVAVGGRPKASHSRSQGGARAVQLRKAQVVADARARRSGLAGSATAGWSASRTRDSVVALARRCRSRTGGSCHSAPRAARRARTRSRRCARASRRPRCASAASRRRPTARARARRGEHGLDRSLAGRSATPSLSASLRPRRQKYSGSAASVSADGGSLGDQAARSVEVAADVGRRDHLQAAILSSGGAPSCSAAAPSPPARCAARPSRLALDCPTCGSAHEPVMRNSRVLACASGSRRKSCATKLPSRSPD